MQNSAMTLLHTINRLNLYIYHPFNYSSSILRFDEWPLILILVALTISATLPCVATRCPEKPSPSRLLRASFTLAAAGYIAPADAAALGDLALGQGRLAAQAVAQGDDLGLPGRQAPAHRPAHPAAGLLEVQILQHGVVHPDHVHEGEVVAVAVVLQRVGQGHLPLELAAASKVHEHLVFDAPAGVGGQLDAPVAFEGAHRLDEPDGADGDQVVLIGRLGVVFLHDMGHQAEVVLHQDVPGLQVALLGQLQVFALLLRLQRPGKGARPPGQPQGEKQPVEHQDDPSRQHMPTSKAQPMPRRIVPMRQNASVS